MFSLTGEIFVKFIVMSHVSACRFSKQTCSVWQCPTESKLLLRTADMQADRAEFPIVCCKQVHRAK